MRFYTISWDYAALGGERQHFETGVKAYNKQEALVRAGAKFREDKQRVMPDIVENVQVKVRSLHGFMG